VSITAGGKGEAESPGVDILPGKIQVLECILQAVNKSPRASGVAEFAAQRYL
jgi:hypothetical protein